MKVKIQVLLDDGSGSLEVYPYKTEKGNTELFHAIRVARRHNDWTGALLPSEVNWGAIGSVGAKEAGDYARGLNLAHSLATEWEQFTTYAEVKKWIYSLPNLLTVKEEKAYWKEMQDKKKAKERERAKALGPK